MNEVMSVYNICTAHSWTLNIKNNYDHRLKHELAMIRSYKELDQFTHYKFTQHFKFLIIQRIFWLGSIADNYHYKQYEIIYKTFYRIVKSRLNVLNKKNEKYLLYGAGTGSKFILEALDHEKVEAILDKEVLKDESIFCGKRVVSLEKLDQFGDYPIIISLFGRSKHVIEFLIEKYDVPYDRFLSFDELLLECYELEQDSCVCDVERTR
ncbi:MAG: hypothetical protein LRY52_00135 [Sulfurospirillum cavolei]|nr:hypothetical protein [Sulfurospirillum cavolei]